MAEGGKRPFWMHQLVEYILGGALVASGLQSPYPLVPAVLGGIVMGHAAITRGALAAFRVIDRRLHRVLDPLVIGLQVLGAVQPWITVDPGTRVIIGGIAAVHFVVWFSSSFSEKPKKPAKSEQATSGQAKSERAESAPAGNPNGTPSDAPVAGDRSAEIGRSAGRMVGSGVNAVRRAKEKRANR